MKYYISILLAATVFTACSQSNKSKDHKSSSSGQADKVIKISQFNMAGYCDFLIDKSGIYHTVFQESPDIGKPNFIYYATSTDKGASWSKPIALSDDNSGAGSGYARILQDGNGAIYAIWKRYGNTTTHDLTTPTLDGPGGYNFGTLFYKVLNGGTWSNEVQLNEVEQAQESWFATVSPTGVVNVVWSQPSAATLAIHGNAWYYCDYMRATTLNGTNPSAYKDLTTPRPPNGTGYPSIQAGYINLDGYVDQSGNYHLVWDDLNNVGGIEALKYYDGKNNKLIYNYPSNNSKNTFFNPARLLVDEKGTDHIIFEPDPSTLQSEQIWDYNAATNQNTILTSIQQQGIAIHGFQAKQGPGGKMAVTIEAGRIMGTNEAFAMFYKNGTWTNVGLTNNASKSNFFYKEFVGLGGGLSSVSLLTTYSSIYASTAYNASGDKDLLMTISGNTVNGAGYGTSAPFIIYVPVDN